MSPIGIDTSVLIGLLDRKDLWHERAVAIKEAILERQLDVVIFDCVLAEAISTLSRRVHEKRRQEELDLILQELQTKFPTDEVIWLFPEVPTRYVEVIEMVRESGGELNFNDSLIALACRDLGISLLASFDRDFDRIEWLTRVSLPDDLRRVID